MKVKWHNDPAPDAPRWRAEDEDGNAIAYAARTGRPGVDNYPWDWYLLIDPGPGRRQSGVTDTLRAAKDQIAQAVRR